MTLNAKIIATVTPIVGVCVPDFLVLEAGETAPEEYCTFDYVNEPEGLSDNTAKLMRALVSLHYYAPRRLNTLPTRKALLRAIASDDLFTVPGVEPANDETGQHYVFEFEALGAGLEA